jgi:MFS family permease
MYNIGSVAAVFFTGPTNDYLGRRAGMFTGALIVIIGTCVQAPSTSNAMFLGGRFVSLKLLFSCANYIKQCFA